MKHVRIPVLLLIVSSFTSQAQFKNIKLAEEVEGGRPMVEPSVTINRKDPKNIVVGYSTDRASYTFDGGITWKETILESLFGVYGDPALISNSKGDMYFFHLSDPSGEGRSNEAWLDRIVVQKSDDGGRTWDKGESIGHNPPADQDKPWPAIHPRKDDLFVTWTQFDEYGSEDPSCTSNIMFSMSTNGGKKWSKAIQINQNPGDCLDSDNTAEGAVPAVGNDGKIYVVWSNRGNIYFDRSFDYGKSWIRNDLLITEQKGGWDMDIPGLGRCNGMPIVYVDNSATKFEAVVYVLWADQENGENDTDIWFTRSTNRGDNWSAPIRINQEQNASHQFMPWMTVDVTTGYIYVVYYDRRDYMDNQTDVYLAYSIDGGYTFSETKISESPFTPTEDKFFGDYNNISAHKGVIVPVWTRMDNGKTSIWSTIIKQEDLIKKAEQEKN
ncbi:MAG: sialidase family protein [Cyclobacteriaceae bacterium]